MLGALSVQAELRAARHLRQALREARGEAAAAAAAAAAAEPFFGGQLGASRGEGGALSAYSPSALALALRPPPSAVERCYMTMAPIRIPSGSYTSSPSAAGASTAPPSSGWDYILKFILIGDSSVGKSSLLVRLTDDRFLADPDPTIGVEFGSHLIRLDNGETVKVQVWDTAGSESFRSITRSYYRGAAGALLVYDITHRPSFLNVKGWLEDVRSHAEDKVSIVLVGNMYDLVEQQDHVSTDGGSTPSDEAAQDTRRARIDRRRSKGKKREVSTAEARQFAQEHGLLFVEASAKTGHNVHEAFAQAARDIHSKFSTPEAETDGAPGGAAKYDGGTLGKRSRMRVRAAGRTSGTVALEPSEPATTTRSPSGFSIRSLTPSTPASGEQQSDRAPSECCVIA
jgi:Ras-related protein Rab-2A